MVTWIVGGIVLVIVGGILWKIIADRKHGKNSCSGNCQNCRMSCGSHTQ